MSETANHVEPFVVPAGEGGLITTGGMTGLELLVPACIHQATDSRIVPDMLLFLTACLIRAQSKEGFIEEQLEWLKAKGQADASTDLN